MTSTAAVRPGASRTRQHRSRLALLVGAGLALLIALAIVHLGQGTGTVPVDRIWAALFGHGGAEAEAVLTASRLPRLVAAVLVGATLGLSGAAIQSISRNVLASPDTLAVNAGAYLAVVAVAAFGIGLPAVLSGGVAFLGGLITAAVVLLLAQGAGPLRLVLAGSALGLALSGVSGVLLLLRAQQTVGLFAWGNGSLLLTGMTGIAQLTPVAVLAAAGLLLLGRRLDILTLGDDGAMSTGVDPRTTRLIATVLAVLLAAVAVTIAGPVGFVGLCAPVLVRLLGARVPGLLRHRAFLPMSALAGALVLLGSDVLLRAAFGAAAGAVVPTGIVTTVLGALVLIVLATRSRDGGATREDGSFARLRSRRAFAVTVLLAAVALVAAGGAATLLGDTKLLLGDLANWADGSAGPIVSYVLETRLPRVAAAVLSGAALAIAGAVVQAVSRNALADPGILGVTGGAGVGAIAVVTLVPLPGALLIGGAALGGAAVAAGLVFGLAARGGLEQNRLVLIGIGVQAAALAVVSLIIVLTDPFSATKALTWLAGSTYGRTVDQVLPVAVALIVGLLVLGLLHREQDVIALDPDTPRLLGLRLGRTRLILLAVAVLLSATSVAAVGTVGFVGLVAPHAARALVGRRTARVLPVAALLGGILVCLADTIGRTVLAPAQLPVGLVTAIIGAPYFLHLLRASRRAMG